MAKKTCANGNNIISKGELPESHISLVEKLPLEQALGNISKALFGNRENLLFYDGTNIILKAFSGKYHYEYRQDNHGHNRLTPVPTYSTFIVGKMKNLKKTQIFDLVKNKIPNIPELQKHFNTTQVNSLIETFNNNKSKEERYVTEVRPDARYNRDQKLRPYDQWFKSILIENGETFEKIKTSRYTKDLQKLLINTLEQYPEYKDGSLTIQELLYKYYPLEDK